MPENRHLRLFVILIYTFLGIFGLYIVFQYIFPLILPFLFALLFSTLISPLVSICQKHLHFPRALASGIFTVLVYLLAGFAIWIICTKIFAQVRDLLSEPALHRLLSSFPSQVKLPEPLLDRAITMAKNIPSVLLGIFVSLLGTYFFTVDRDRIAEYLRKKLPKTARRMFSDTYRAGYRTVMRYLRATLLLFLVTFSELTVGLLLLRVRYAVGIAFLIALVDAVPVLGTGAVLLPWALGSFLGGERIMALGLLILYLVILTVRNLIEPKVLGKQIGLHPLATLALLYFGLQIFGVFGFLLPLPAAIALELYKNRGNAAV